MTALNSKTRRDVRDVDNQAPNPIVKIAKIGAFTLGGLIVIIVIAQAVNLLTRTSEPLGDFIPLEQAETEADAEGAVEDQRSAISDFNDEAVQQVRMDDYTRSLAEYDLRSSIFFDAYVNQRKIAWISEARAKHSQDKERWKTPGQYLVYAQTGIFEIMSSLLAEDVTVDSSREVLSGILNEDDGPVLEDVKRLALRADTEDQVVNILFDFEVLSLALRDVGKEEPQLSHLDTKEILDAAGRVWRSGVITHDPNVRAQIERQQREVEQE